MRKIDRNFCAWMMAGALAVGTLSGGWTAPAQVWAASEKKKEKQKTDEKAQEQQTEADAEGTVRHQIMCFSHRTAIRMQIWDCLFSCHRNCLKKWKAKRL